MQGSFAGQHILCLYVFKVAQPSFAVLSGQQRHSNSIVLWGSSIES